MSSLITTFDLNVVKEFFVEDRVLPNTIFDKAILISGELGQIQK